MKNKDIKKKDKRLKEHQLCNCNDCGGNHRWCITHDKCTCEEVPTSKIETIKPI